MVWEQLSVNKPHLVYLILGGFTSLFMLCSSIIKEKFYIGEATVATLCGIIFGPHAANLIDPGSWGNVDQITLEFSRIVLVVQCFAVGVELPKYYMEKHWRSVVFLLIPVMTFGWMMTSLFIWGMFYKQMNWLDSLLVAACVTATDPVLASSVVGKGKFAQRVPRHLRDLLSAESGCNDGMAFPFVYLAFYLIEYRHDSATEVAKHWICNTILYECIAGATYGVVVGYIARRGIRYAHEHNLIDRESFLVFYFVLALFCAGSGALLGMDDLLIGFACGVGFSNDGWFLEKTEEAHVSNVIDLLINLAFFVYFGTVIPWETYSSAIIGTTPWKLVVIALLVLFFRRLPIMLALKPVIPDVKTWREAFFAGHFGPIGVGAIFVAILARAELETDSTTPLAQLPEEGFEHLNVIELIWPITTFLVITSIIVHGSSIAVFTLGKHINTLSLTMSFTKEKDNQAWMDRLPRIQSRSKSQMSASRLSTTSDDLEENLPDYPAATLPKDFLRRQREGETPSSPTSGRSMRKRPWRSSDEKTAAGGHVEQSAIGPIRKLVSTESPTSGSSDTAVPSPTNEEDQSKHDRGRREGEPQEEIYQEGDDTIIEDEEGNVLKVMKSPSDERKRSREEKIEKEASDLMSSEDVQHGVSQKEDQDPNPEVKKEAAGLGDQVKELAHGRKPPLKKNMFSKLGGSKLGGLGEKYHYKNREKTAPAPATRRPGPARAFKFGNTIIVEDEDGEVIKKYELPAPAERKFSYVDPDKTRERLTKMGKWMGMGVGGESGEAGPSSEEQRSRKKSTIPEEQDDDDVRFTVEGDTRRMSKADFFTKLQSMDPKKRAALVERSDAPEAVKEEARDDAEEHIEKQRQNEESDSGKQPRSQNIGKRTQLERAGTWSGRPAGAEGTLNTDEGQDIPVHNFSEDLSRHSLGGMTAAEKRRQAASRVAESDDSEDDGKERVPPQARGRGLSPAPRSSSSSRSPDPTDERETAAEKRRREAALNQTAEDSDSDEDGVSPRRRARTEEPSSSSQGPSQQPKGIRFAGDAPPKESKSVFGSVRWGGERGR